VHLSEASQHKIVNSGARTPVYRSLMEQATYHYCFVLIEK
jgi:hypothetical protein